MARIGFIASEEMSFENIDDDGCLPIMSLWLRGANKMCIKWDIIGEVAKHDSSLLKSEIKLNKTENLQNCKLKTS